MAFRLAVVSPFCFVEGVGAGISAFLMVARRGRRTGSNVVRVAAGRGSRPERPVIVAQGGGDVGDGDASVRIHRPPASRLEREAQQALVFDTYRRFGIR